MPRLLLLLTLLVASGCRNEVGQERCYRAEDCAGGEACLALPSGANVCVDRCDVSLELVCASGRTCAEVPVEDAGVAVCLPPGDVDVGDVCTRTLDCEAGAACIARVGQAQARCERLCDAATGTGCATPLVCVALDASAPARGTCVTP